MRTGTELLAWLWTLGFVYNMEVGMYNCYVITARSPSMCARRRMCVCSEQLGVFDLAKLVNKTQGAVICFSNMQWKIPKEKGHYHATQVNARTRARTYTPSISL